MPAAKTKEYHAILDLLDRGQHDVAADRMFVWFAKLSNQEFRLLLNAFVRRGVSLRTS